MEKTVRNTKARRLAKILLGLLAAAAALRIGLRACGLLNMPRKRETAYILAFAGVFILVYLVRLLCGDPVIAPDPESGLLFRLLRAL